MMMKAGFLFLTTVPIIINTKIQDYKHMRCKRIHL